VFVPVGRYYRRYSILSSYDRDGKGKVEITCGSGRLPRRKVRRVYNYEVVV
jgi:hypothetical protein